MLQPGSVTAARRRHTVLAPAIAMMAIASTASAQESGFVPSGDLRSEAQLVIDKIFEVHPRRAELVADAPYIAATKAMLAEANGLDAPRFVIRMLAMMNHIADAHTVVIPYSLQHERFQPRLPISLERFEDGYYVTAVTREASQLLGSRITEVDGTPVQDVISRLAGVMPQENPGWPTRWTSLFLASPALLRGLDVVRSPAGAPVLFVGEAADGSEVRAALAPGTGELAALQRARSDSERWAAGEPSENFVRVVPESKALYVSLAPMGDTESRSFDEFDALWTEQMATPGLERMIIDLRDNGGGNNMLPEPMRRRIVRSRFNKLGRLFVLIGPVTFSAAQNFATRIERETDALFVGEPTGGRPNHLGDPTTVPGPATGGLYLVSTLRWTDSPPYDTRPWILPDVPVPPTFADYMSGRDRALETALGYVPERDESPLRWMRPWDRASQKAGWSYFWEQGEP